MEGLDIKTRLEVVDKRALFQSLLAMSERLLMLNKFPVDQLDFALSVLRPDEEAAIRLLQDTHPSALFMTDTFVFSSDGTDLMLHTYPCDKYRYAHQQNIFPKVGLQAELTPDNKYYREVSRWVRKQVRLEEQVLRTAKVIKALVHSCNTVGQYQRVSPELVTFLPEKYRAALKDYQKKSPYPALTVEPEEIDAAIANLAFASLQPPHFSEEEYISRFNRFRCTYMLKPFPRTTVYLKHNYRVVEI